MNIITRPFIYLDLEFRKNGLRKIFLIGFQTGLLYLDLFSLCRGTSAQVFHKLYDLWRSSIPNHY